MTFDSFADAIHDFRTQSICDAVKVSPVRVAAWRKGDLPRVRFIPALATLLRMDLADLTRLIATEEQLREDSRLAHSSEQSL
jgi:hypothetical protein